MKNKKLTPLLIGCCILTSSFPAFAEELQLPEGKKAELMKVENIKGDTVKEELSSKNPESILDTLEVDKDGFFNDLETAILNGEEFQISEIIGKNSDTQISTESKFDLSDMTLLSDTMLDMGSTNLKYESFATQMLDGFEKVDLSGSSEGCIGKFKNEFGESLANMSLEEAKLPEGLTVENLLSSASGSIHSAYQSAINSEGFSGIKNQISIGNIFNVANQGLSMPELESMGTLTGMNQLQESINKDYASSQHAAMQGGIRDSLSEYQENLSYITNEELLNLIDTDNQLMDFSGKINAGNLESIADDIRDMYHDVFPNQYGIFELGSDITHIGDLKEGTYSILKDALVDFDWVDNVKDFVGGLFD